MALIKCKECGHSISDKAAVCPRCGAKLPARTSAVTWVVAIVLGIPIIITMARFGSSESPSSDAPSASSPTRPGACTAASIRIKSMDARFVDPCSRSSCPHMAGVAVLENGCSQAIGVQVKIVGQDASGTPISSRDLWPASVSNIPPGDYTFSLDHYLPYDSRLKTFNIRPIAVKRWNDR